MTVKLNFEWKENKGQYQTGESLYLGRILIGSYGWNSSRSKTEAERDNAKDWSGQVNLPQARKGIYGQDTEEVRIRVEKVVIGWFKEALRSK